GQIATLTNGFIYVDPKTLGPAPAVTAVNPGTGGTIDPTNVTIAATNVALGALVFVGGLPASGVVVQSPGAIAVFPPNTAGSADVAITNPDGQTGKLIQGFTWVKSPPQLTTISPGTLPLACGLKILI